MPAAINHIIMKCLPLLLALCCCAAQADVRIAIESPATAFGKNAEVTVDVLAANEGEQPAFVLLPAVIDAHMVLNNHRWPVQLKSVQGETNVQLVPMGFIRRRYQLVPPTDVTGRLTLEIEAPFTSRGIVELRDFEVDENGTAKPEERPAISLIERSFTSRFALHEPIYFIYGPEAPSVKFQFSFKYRLIGQDSAFGLGTPSSRGLYFGFTQRSLWDTDAMSSPFFDTSYMPELFYEWLGEAKTLKTLPWFHWVALQVGIRHESNGKDGIDSRSLNMAYLRPVFVLGNLDGWNLMVGPRAVSYYTVGRENSDIDRYRGHGDVWVVFGKNGGLKVGLNAYTGRDNVQLDVTHPIRIPLIGLETYFHAQYFNGYGESLRTYNQRSTLWRAGISFVR